MKTSKLVALLSVVLSLPALASAAEVKITEKEPILEFNGFVDLAVSGNATSRSSSFALSEFEIDLKKSFKDIASFRVDLNFRIADAIGPTGDLIAPNYDQLLEQAYVTIDALKKKTGLSFLVGKFNTPIGFESLDPPDRYQLSLSNVFSLLLPFNTLGGMMMLDRGLFSLKVYVVKGWDKLIDNNNSLTFGGRMGFTLAGGKVGLGFSALWGPEGEKDGDARTVFDMDFTLTLGKLVWGLEANFGTQPEGSGVVPGSRATWAGFLTTLHYRWFSWLATTLRYDLVYDPDGAMAQPGVGHTRHSVTTAALFPITQGKAPFGVATGAMAGLEYRADIADANVFEDSEGGLAKVRHIIAAKMVYAW